jgi:hypothetical protein
MDTFPHGWNRSQTYTITYDNSSSRFSSHMTLLSSGQCYPILQGPCCPYRCAHVGTIDITLSSHILAPILASTHLDAYNQDTVLLRTVGIFYRVYRGGHVWGCILDPTRLEVAWSTLFLSLDGGSSNGKIPLQVVGRYIEMLESHDNDSHNSSRVYSFPLGLPLRHDKLERRDGPSQRKQVLIRLHCGFCPTDWANNIDPCFNETLLYNK